MHNWHPLKQTLVLHFSYDYCLGLLCPIHEKEEEEEEKMREGRVMVRLIKGGFLVPPPLLSIMIILKRKKKKRRVKRNKWKHHWSDIRAVRPEWQWGSNWEDMMVVVANNCCIKLSDEQIDGILDEVFHTYSNFIRPDCGLILDGLLHTYNNSAGDVDHNFDALDLHVPNKTEAAASSIPATTFSSIICDTQHALPIMGSPTTPPSFIHSTSS